MELKTISPEAIPHAIQKAERYRLLNQSWATESICLDILEIDPANQQVLVMMLLSLTDQFGSEARHRAHQARLVLDRLVDPYQRHYYAGIIAERLAHAHLAQGGMHAEAMAHESLHRAMEEFDRASALRAPGNDNAILRWNTCARARHRLRVADETENMPEPVFGE